MSEIRWDDVLDELRQLPTDSAIWDAISQFKMFLGGLEALTQEKLQERDQYLTDIQAAIDGLVAENAGELEYFRLEVEEAWDASLVTPRQAPIVAEQIAALSGLLAQYRDLRTLTPAHIDEAVESRDQQEDLEEDIEELNVALAAVLIAASDEEEADDEAVAELEGEVEASAEDEEAAEDETASEEEAEDEAAEVEEATAEADEEVEASADEEAASEEESEDESDDSDEEEAAEVEEVVAEADEEVEASADEEAASEEESEDESDDSDEEEVAEVEEIAAEADEEVEASADEEAASEEESEDESDDSDEEEVAEVEEIAAEADEEAEASTEEETEESPPDEAEPELEEAVPGKALSRDSSEADSAAEISASPISQDVTPAPTKEELSDKWDSFFWALIHEDDLAGAYWLSRSLESRGYEPPVPDWLLASVQGARWLSPDSTRFVTDLAEIARYHQPDQEDELQALLGLSTAIRVSLSSQSEALTPWLNVPDNYSYLENLVTAVREFGQTDLPVQVSQFLDEEGQAELETSIRQASEDAQEWLSEVRSTPPVFRRASEVLNVLLASDTGVGAMLRPVSGDVRSQATEVRDLLSNWERYEYASEQVDENYTGLVRGQVSEASLVADARQWVLLRIEEACNRARRWSELVESGQQLQARGEEVAGQLTDLTSTVEQSVQDALASLQELAEIQQETPLGAAVNVLRRTVGQLGNQVLDDPVYHEDRGSTARTLERLVADTENLNVGIARRLLWMPGIALDDNGEPLSEAIDSLAEEIRSAAAEVRSIDVALSAWLDLEDYRFVTTMLGAVSNQDSRTSLEGQYQDSLTSSISTLSGRLSQVSSALEEVESDGGLDQETLDEYSEVVSGIEPENVRNFSSAQETLDEVSSQLTEGETTEAQTD